MKIQQIINAESKELSEAFELKKDGSKILKGLKKELKSTLVQNPEWIELEEKIKVLKTNKKDIGEQIKEAEKAQDQIAAQLEEYIAADEFKVDMEEKFNEQVDKTLTKLSKEISQNGIEGEVEYKSGKLSIIVAKH